ncbi:triphosphoribosyl-dephospho-CoA synthase [Azospirillum halopraeferens]|uniref:triphosphoribosyl-dephospho-CoA synthase n=1 Tax=Azospirillum halopraeferens TaxID=34010 RepID=UPI00040FD942|nr:triphosphoribosyl-dephospho-CoA synthase [Azospirillum halopraeferens]
MPSWIEVAVRDACLDELQALKPGNVHVHAAGVDALLADFTHSAAVAAVALCNGPPGVGARILRAVRATRDAVGHNTNLGIVLLAAPLAEAVLNPPPPAEGADAGAAPLRAVLARVLAGLTRADADAAFRAIALAAPAGLGRPAAHDVHEPARVTLLEAMRAAAGRDRVAAQYATAYAEVFEAGLPRLAAALDAGVPAPWAATAVHLGFLADGPDSHILRKHGAATAATVCGEAADLERRRRDHGGDPRPLAAALRRFDAALRGDGLNPGTCADLTVATLLARRIEKSFFGLSSNYIPSET